MKRRKQARPGVGFFVDLVPALAGAFYFALGRSLEEALEARAPPQALALSLAIAGAGLGTLALGLRCFSLYIREEVKELKYIFLIKPAADGSYRQSLPEPRGEAFRPGALYFALQKENATQSEFEAPARVSK